MMMLRSCSRFRLVQSFSHLEVHFKRSPQLRTASSLSQSNKLQQSNQHYIRICRFLSTTTGGSSDGDNNNNKKPSKRDEKEVYVPSEEDMDEEEDEFGTIGFDVSAEDEARERERVAAELAALEDTEEDLTPRIASDLVKRMVAAAREGTVGKEGMSAGGGQVMTKITRNSIRVLGAMRIQTNEIVAPMSREIRMPIEQKVLGFVEVEKLGLSELAKVALEMLAGTRWRNGIIKLVCQKYTTSEENQAHVLWMADRLVTAAQVAVGEDVDETPVDSWDDIMKYVEGLVETEDDDSKRLVEGVRLRAEESASAM